MKLSQYRVTFSYTYVIDATDQDAAEDKAYQLFNEDAPVKARDYAAIVEEVN